MSNAVPQRLRDALAELMNALEHSVVALEKGLESRGKPSDQHILSMGKILTEVANSHMEFAVALAGQTAGWWCRRLHELKQGARAPEPKVEKELGRGAG